MTKTEARLRAKIAMFNLILFLEIFSNQQYSYALSDETLQYYSKCEERHKVNCEKLIEVWSSSNNIEDLLEKLVTDDTYNCECNISIEIQSECMRIACYSDDIFEGLTGAYVITLQYSRGTARIQVAYYRFPYFNCKSLKRNKRIPMNDGWSVITKATFLPNRSE